MVKKTQLADSGWALTEEMKAWARREVPSVDIQKQLALFQDYWLAHGKPMASWDATFRNWMRRAPEFTKPVDQFSRMRTVPNKVSPPPTPDQEEAYRRRMEAASRDAEMKYGRRQ